MRIRVEDVREDACEGINDRPHDGEEHEESHDEEEIEADGSPLLAENVCLDNGNVNTLRYQPFWRQNSVGIESEQEERDKTKTRKDEPLVNSDKSHPALPSLHILFRCRENV